MKYIINKRTKEHRAYTDEYFEDADVWDIVEADDEGWIAWSGGECPLPVEAGHVVRLRDGLITVRSRPTLLRWGITGDTDDITAYRPILSEAARRPGRTIAFIPPTEHNVFTRLHEATAAAESIPGIIKEIDELLAPAGYCVARRQAEMSGMDEIVEKVMDGKITPNKARQIRFILENCEKAGISPQDVVDAVLRGLQ